MRTGVVSDYSDLARLGIVSRPRITQVMNLLNLAPSIQEEILFIAEEHAGRDAITEASLRRLPAILDWKTQLEAWRRLTAEHAR